MPPHAVQQLLAAQVASPPGPWPETVAGWVALIASVGAVIAMLWGYAKFLAQLNGLGGRVDKLEKEQAAAAARDTQHLLALERVIGAQTQIIRDQGEQARALDEARDSTRDFAIDIGSKLDHLSKAMTDGQRQTAEKIGAMQATLDMLTRNR